MYNKYGKYDGQINEVMEFTFFFLEMPILYLLMSRLKMCRYILFFFILVIDKYFDL